ncbi:MAG: hypothetical protein GF401_07120 [Chitinivibrionales bacterium]|nr:hypothetical protein [Chitinivibrionales bacterium]
MKYFFYYYIIIISLPCFPVTYLTGELSGHYGSDNYVVSGNIHILPGTELSFAAGSTIRFEPFTGIIVRGKLICEGTADSVVLFTSTRDPLSGSTPEPFDWNGIKVPADAEEIVLSNARVEYSTFGLDIESNGTEITLKDVVFRKNGYATLTRAGRIVEHVEGVPVDYTWKREGSYNHTNNEKETAGSSAAKENKGISWKIPVRIAVGTFLASGLSIWVGGHTTAEKYNQKYLDEDVNISNAVAYRDNRDNAVKWRNAGALLSLISAAGLGITFIF